MKDTVSLIDVIITNEDSIGELATEMDLGYSDQKSQILQLILKTVVRKCKKINQGNILKKSIEEFKCLLNKEPWQEELQTAEVNSALQEFMDFLVITSIEHSHTN